MRGFLSFLVLALVVTLLKEWSSGRGFQLGALLAVLSLLGSTIIGPAWSLLRRVYGWRKCGGLGRRRSSPCPQRELPVLLPAQDTATGISPWLASSQLSVLTIDLHFPLCILSLVFCPQLSFECGLKQFVLFALKLRTRFEPHDLLPNWYRYSESATDNVWVRKALVILLEPMQALVLAAAWLYARVL